MIDYSAFRIILEKIPMKVYDEFIKRFGILELRNQVTKPSFAK